MTYRFKIVLLLATVAVATVWARDGQAGPIHFDPAPFAHASHRPFIGTAFSDLHGEAVAHGRLNTPEGRGSANGVFRDHQSDDSVAADRRTNNSAHPFYSDSTNTFLPFTFDASDSGTWAYDSAGVSLGLFNPFASGDRHAKRESGEDGFMGGHNVPSMSAIPMRTTNRDRTFDHRRDDRGAQFSPTGADLSPIAVPEPATLLLLGTGLIAVVRRARQRRL